MGGGKGKAQLERITPPTPRTDTRRLLGELGDDNSVLIGGEVPYDSQDATTEQRGVGTPRQVQRDFGTAIGLLSGGDSYGSTDAQTFTVEAGTGEINNAYDDPNMPSYARLVWDTEELIVPIEKAGPGENVTAVSYFWIKPSTTTPAPGEETVTGTVFQTNTPPTGAEKARMLLMGRANWAPAVARLVGVESTPRPSSDIIGSLYALADTLGSLPFLGGELIPQSGTMTLKVKKLTVFGVGINWEADRSDPQVRVIDDDAVRRIRCVYRPSFNNGDLIAIGGPPTESISPDVWDDGSGGGSPATVPDGKVTISRVFATPTVISTSLRCSLGQVLYSSLEEAHRAITTERREVYNADVRALHIGSIAMVKGATDLTDPAQALVYDVHRDRRYSVQSAPPELPGRILQRAVATPITISPTIATATPTPISEMSVVMTPMYAGSRVRLVFECSALHSLKNACLLFQGYVNGAPFKFPLCEVAVKNNGALTLQWGGSYTVLDTSAHTFEMYWWTDGGTGTGVTVNRGFSAEEISEP